MLTAAIIALALATAAQTPAQTSGQTPGPENAPYTKEMGLGDKPSMYGLSWFGGDEPLPRPAAVQALHAGAGLSLPNP